MTLPRDETGNAYFEDGNCGICGKLTVRTGFTGVDAVRGDREPFVCNKCLIDLRGDMATELEVRRQLGNLEAKLEGYAWKQWILYFAFTLIFAALTFVAGLWLGS
jgi:hypothetical protein